jgi:hypothetical protein
MSLDLLRELAALKRHANKSMRTGLPIGNFRTLSVPVELLARIDAALADHSVDTNEKVDP